MKINKIEKRLHCKQVGLEKWCTVLLEVILHQARLAVTYKNCLVI